MSELMDKFEKSLNEIKERKTETSKQFGDLTVIAQINDNREGLFFRLVCGDKKTHWSKHYEGILTLKVGNRIFGLCSGYWDGSLPIEEPFEIITGK